MTVTANPADLSWPRALEKIHPARRVFQPISGSEFHQSKLTPRGAPSHENNQDGGENNDANRGNQNSRTSALLMDISFIEWIFVLVDKIHNPPECLFVQPPARTFGCQKHRPPPSPLPNPTSDILFAYKIFMSHLGALKCAHLHLHAGASVAKVEGVSPHPRVHFIIPQPTPALILLTNSVSEFPCNSKRILVQCC